MTRYDDPSTDELFYARALGILVGPGRRLAHLMRLVSLAYWIAVIAALGWLFSQGIDRAAPVTVHAGTLVSEAVHPGEPVLVRYSFTRRRTCETDTTWLVFDGAEQVTRFGPIHSTGNGLPGDETMVHAWPTPATIPPGQGRLRVISAFSCPGQAATWTIDPG